MLDQRKNFYKNALSLMLPLIVQNFVTQFMQLADTFMVGAVGETELAAVTSANSLFFVVGLICFGIQSGASVLVTQYHGRENYGAINRVLGMGLYMSVAVTGVIAIVAFVFPTEIMRLLTNNESLWAPGADYARIVGFSYIFMSISGTYVAAQRSMENPKLGAYIFSVSGALNIVLNYILIFGKLGAPAMGCAGAAVATLISRAFEVVVIAFYAPVSKILKLDFSAILHPGKIIIRDFFKYSLPVIMNEGLWSLAVALYAIILGHMENSTHILAAYTLAGNLDKLMSVGLFAAGSAAAVIIGRDVVTKDKDEIRADAMALNKLCFVTGLVGSAVVLLTRAYLCDSVVFPLMELSLPAQSVAKYMLLVIACVTPLRAINLCNVVGVFRGGGDVRYALFCDISPMYALTVPAAAAAALVIGAPIEIVYVCMCLDDVIKIFLSYPRLKSGKWINDITRDEILPQAN